MKKEFQTKDGKVLQELTAQQVQDFAAQGDMEALKELHKTAKKDTAEERIKALENFLGL